MAFNKTGTLIVNVTAASGALPIAGTVVRIIGTDEENRGVEYSIITDVDGITERITLPTPARELSQSPGANEQSYALYNIEVSAPGYYTKHIYDVAVFDGTETVQPVNMIPGSIHENRETYPRDNLDTYVRENERLE